MIGSHQSAEQRRGRATVADEISRLTHVRRAAIWSARVAASRGRRDYVRDYVTTAHHANLAIVRLLRRIGYYAAIAAMVIGVTHAAMARGTGESSTGRSRAHTSGEARGTSSAKSCDLFSCGKTDTASRNQSIR